MLFAGMATRTLSAIASTAGNNAMHTRAATETLRRKTNRQWDRFLCIFVFMVHSLARRCPSVLASELAESMECTSFVSIEICSCENLWVPETTFHGLFVLNW